MQILGCYSLGPVAEHTRALVACVVVLGTPPSHTYLIANIRLCEWAISSALHWVIASSGTRWSSCNPVVLVTLGGCHLLDRLVVWSLSKHAKKLVRCSKEDCEGCCARPAGATKSNSSWACHWATLTFGVGSCGAQRAGLAGDAN